ncbi:Flp family type IVb pilin [Mesorhizobium sp. NBSH29]|uniref:Flp family type IVb pilin n=1 Tax=Mesorhizobium sp. NBSH29 TaxID=2654249 RepID=UPI0018967E41|nr:Flp family type IVb pilin [Mesorhizobium sp. NBSH29]QPC85649.1 Flp family type IVb pilin [Mesorhizobium sp. NBSH29]
MIRQFLKHQGGATAIEYGLIGALISLAIVAGASSSGMSLGDLWIATATKLSAGLQN